MGGGYGRLSGKDGGLGIWRGLKQSLFEISG